MWGLRFGLQVYGFAAVILISRVLLKFTASCRVSHRQSNQNFWECRA